VTNVVELVEYESRDYELTGQQARDLAGTGIVAVQPAWTHGAFRVTATSTIGVLRVRDDLEIRVRPKLPVRRVIYLLAHAVGLAVWDERIIDLDDDAEIDLALASAFANAAELALQRGPRSDYFTVDDALYLVRGRLNTNEQRRRFGCPLPVSVTYDEYGPDILENQLLLGAANVLRRLASPPPTLRRRLRRVVVTLDGVRPGRRNDAHREQRFSRLNEHYRPAVALARIALLGHGFELGRQSPAIGFTVDMNRVFEGFLSVALADAIERRHGGHLISQRPDHLDTAHHVRIRPDLTWIVDGYPAAVVDAKYKALGGGGGPADPDLYQAVAYAIALDVPVTYLVHATRSNGYHSLDVRNSGVIVRISGLDLSAPLDNLRSQVDHLADDMAEAVVMRGLETATSDAR
jgi:5-methylcytosine-specific restriction enzyme subunit McrC